MLAVDTQIKTAYEVNGMSPKEIADDQGFAEESVKAKLMQISAKYRKDAGLEDEAESALNFSISEAEEMKGIVLNVARTTDDDNLRFKAATWVLDDKKGRKDVVKALQNGPVLNLLTINEFFAKGREAANNMKEKILNNREAIEA
jgi:hypothetical protein